MKVKANAHVVGRGGEVNISVKRGGGIDRDVSHRGEIAGPHMHYSPEDPHTRVSTTPDKDTLGLEEKKTKSVE